jgi:hypothetical protein
MFCVAHSNAISPGELPSKRVILSDMSQSLRGAHHRMGSVPLHHTSGTCLREDLGQHHT